MSMVREPVTDDCKSQGNQWTLDTYSRIKWYEFNGMESNGRMELRNPPSTNMRYSTMLYNVEEQYVHELVIVPGTANMQSQDK